MYDNPLNEASRRILIHWRGNGFYRPISTLGDQLSRYSSDDPSVPACILMFMSIDHSGYIHASGD